MFAGEGGKTSILKTHQKFRAKYGPIHSFYAGNYPVVVVSDYKVMTELFKDDNAMVSEKQFQRLINILAETFFGLSGYHSTLFPLPPPPCRAGHLLHLFTSSAQVPCTGILQTSHGHQGSLAAAEKSGRSSVGSRSGTCGSLDLASPAWMSFLMRRSGKYILIVAIYVKKQKLQ